MQNNKVLNSLKKKQHMGPERNSEVYPIHSSSFNYKKKSRHLPSSQIHQELMNDATKFLNKRYLPAINKVKNPNLFKNKQSHLKIAKKKISKPINIITDQFAITKDEKSDINLKINNDQNQKSKFDSNVVLQSLKPCSVVLKRLPFKNITNDKRLIYSNRNNTYFKQSNQITSNVEKNGKYLISSCSVVLKKFPLEIKTAKPVTYKYGNNKFFKQSNMITKKTVRKKKNKFISLSDTKKNTSFDDDVLTAFGSVNKFEGFASPNHSVKQNSFHLKKVKYSSSPLTKSFEKSSSQLTSCITSSKCYDITENIIIKESNSTHYFLRKRNPSISYTEEEMDEVSECCSKCDVINSCCELCDFLGKKTKKSEYAENKANKIFNGNKKCRTYKLNKGDFKRAKLNSKASKYQGKHETSEISKYTRKHKAFKASRKHKTAEEKNTRKKTRKHRTSEASKYTKKCKATKVLKFHRKHASNFASSFLPSLGKEAFLGSQNQNIPLNISKWSKFIKPCSVVLSNIIKPCYVRLTPINFQLSVSDVTLNDLTHTNLSDETINLNKVIEFQSNSYESIEKVLILKENISNYSTSLTKKRKIASFKSLDRKESVLLNKKIKLNMNKQQSENCSELISKINMVNNVKASFTSFNKVHFVQTLSLCNDLFFQHRLINKNCLLVCYSNVTDENSKNSFFTFMQFVYDTIHCSSYSDSCFKHKWTDKIKLSAMKDPFRDLALCKNSDVSFFKKCLHFISKKFSIDSGKTVQERSYVISNSYKLNNMRNLSKSILEASTCTSTQPDVSSSISTVCKKSSLLADNFNLTKLGFYKSKNSVSESTITKSNNTAEQISEQYKCEQCSALFNSSKALYYHLCSNKVKKGFLCNICGKYLDLYRALKKHELSHSNKGILKRSNRVKNKKASENALKKIDPSKELDEEPAVALQMVAQSINKKRKANFGEEKSSSPKKRFPKIYVPFEMLNHASTSKGIYSHYSVYKML